MVTDTLFRPEPRLALLAPPYEEFEEIDTDWRSEALPPRGHALVWWAVDAEKQRDQLEWIHSRPHGLPLLIVLPPPERIAPVLGLARYFPAIRPKALLPTCSMILPEQLRRLLTISPKHLVPSLVQYLVRRRLLHGEKVRREIQKTLELSAEVTSIARLSRKLYTSRRTLGRHCLAAGLPVPSHWLQLGRLLHVATRIQNESVSISRLITDTGYPDAFTMSNQMKRLLGCRPSEVRRCLGWEWIVESWIALETQTGRIDPGRHREVVEYYLDGRARAVSVDVDVDEDEEALIGAIA